MIRLQKWIATAGGIGFMGKGGGSVAAAAYCVICFFIPATANPLLWQVLIILFITGIGVWSANGADRFWGHDSSKVVIDEVAGMMIALFLVPYTTRYIIAGFILFRFFDIAKPLYIKKAEKLPRGWGVMADDVLAGIYAHIILSILIVTKLL